MKKGLKILTGFAAVSLVFSASSLASAKGFDKGRPAFNQQKHHEKDGDLDENQQKQSQKEEKKKAAAQSKFGKEIENRINSSEASIHRITESINKFFGVTNDGTTDLTLSKRQANSRYNSFKGKLNAEINKLRAMDRQLSAGKKNQKLPAADLKALSERTKNLQQLAKDEIKRVQTLVQQALAPKTGDGTATTPAPSTTDGTTAATPAPSTTDGTSAATPAPSTIDGTAASNPAPSTTDGTAATTDGAASAADASSPSL